MLAATLAYAQETFKNPVVWADMPDPDVIRTARNNHNASHAGRTNNAL